MGAIAQGTGLYRLRILHVSDLHERGPREKEPWRKRRMFDDAWERNVAELMQDGPFDLICFSGDIADWGLAEEYAQATEFCEGLLDRLRVPADRLFVIPGNHDIMRNLETDVWEKMRMQLADGVDPLDFSRYMNGLGSAPPGIEASWRERILGRESGYRQWVCETLKRPELAPQGLGYRASVQIDKWPFPIHVLGLDTAWLCGDF